MTFHQNPVSNAVVIVITVGYGEEIKVIVNFALLITVYLKTVLIVNLTRVLINVGVVRPVCGKIIKNA